MKKNLLCLFSALLVLASCSSDVTREDDDTTTTNPTEGQTFLKKTIEKEDGLTLTTNYKYNGNKLVSVIDSNGGSMIYTYTGDLITKLEFKLADGTLEQVNSYMYSTDGKLTTFTRVEPLEDYGYRESYTYNANGTITVNSYGGNVGAQNDVGGKSTITFLNGVVIEIISTNSPNHKYTYDTKNNPLKNVLGMDKIAFVDGEADGNLHNILTDHTGDAVWASSIYTYNTSNYPATSIETTQVGKVSTEYFYQ